MRQSVPPWTGYGELAANYWKGFTLPDHGDLVGESVDALLDVGTGTGARIRDTAMKCRTVVVTDVDVAALKECGESQLLRVCCRAEALPFRSATFDCVCCFVALPYTQPAEAIGEMASTLRDGNARLVITGHGPGYYLRYLLQPPNVALAWYALLTAINSIGFIISGRRLIGGAGDIWQSRRLLGRCYVRAGVTLVAETLSATYMGLPVFLHHTLRLAKGRSGTRVGNT